MTSQATQSGPLQPFALACAHALRWLGTIICFLMVSGVATAIAAAATETAPAPERKPPPQTAPVINTAQPTPGDNKPLLGTQNGPALPSRPAESANDAAAGLLDKQNAAAMSPEQSVLAQALQHILGQDKTSSSEAEKAVATSRGKAKGGRQSQVAKLYAQAAADDRAALAEFYAARGYRPVWMTHDGPTEKASALIAALAEAPAYGLDPALIPAPDLAKPGAEEAVNSEHLAETEIGLSMAALTYARHARGGRIPQPAELLNSNLDRKPQLHSPVVVMSDLAEAKDIRAAMAGLHPVHPQFEKLRQALLKETGGNGRGKLSANAKRIRANMEFWRWMWDDLGELYVFNNLPEYMQYVVRKGEVIRQARIVVGEVSKQSSVFSRPLKDVVLRPRWRVPESIMVRELWPSLRGSGSLMRRYGLEITTKSGEPRDWRDINWHKDDIRNYHVWQPPGRKSVLGFVKFSFPSQHTIFMHDTPDKWMFNRGRRTLSHGCLRVKDPMGLTEILLAYDHGWNSAKIKSLIRSGPLDNKIHMTRHIPIHLAYFTAWAKEDGTVRYFSDIYGHEKRVRQALDGDWDKIHKGRDHLAKPQPKFKKTKDAGSATVSRRKSKQPANVADMIAGALGF